MYTKAIKNASQVSHQHWLEADPSGRTGVIFGPVPVYSIIMFSDGRFPAFQSRDFRLFWFGQLVSLSGTWMHSVAQSWLVYSLTHSPLYLGIIASLASMPILLFTLLGGIVADRYPKRTVLMLTQFLSAMLALIVAVLADFGVITVWHVGAVAFALGMVNAFDVPTRQAFLVEVVDRTAITNAIALNSVAFNGARILGPVVAGFVISLAGIPACFYLNAVSFIAVLAALFSIRERQAEYRDTKGLLSELVDGWRFVIHERAVFRIMALIAVFSLFGIPYLTFMPIFAEDILSSGVTGLSILVASAGIGSLVAAAWIAINDRTSRKRAFLPFAALVFSAAITALPFTKTLLAASALIFLAGWGIVSFLATANSFVQHAVPDELRGRVMSLYTLVFLGFAPLGNSIIGIMAQVIGTLPSLKLTGIICIIMSVLFAQSFPRRSGVSRS